MALNLLSSIRKFKHLSTKSAYYIIQNVNTYVTLKERQRMYNPSKWSKRYESEELLERFNKLCLEGTEKARKTLPCQLDIPYGSTERTKYDIYGTTLPKNAPIFVFIHGGYWQSLSKDYGGFMAPLFVKNKIKVAAIQYDLCPNVTLKNITEQIKAAVAHILKYAADTESKHVCILGHSAGAFLAASLLHDSDWIDRMTQQGHFKLLKEIILISGIYNLKPLVEINFADNLGLTDEDVRTLSFLMLKEEDRQIRDLKIILATGEIETPISRYEANEYVKKMIAIADNVECLLLRDIDHHDIVERLTDPNHQLTKLILNYFRFDENID